jgi:hypothetical protein
MPGGSSPSTNVRFTKKGCLPLLLRVAQHPVAHCYLLTDC